MKKDKGELTTFQKAFIEKKVRLLGSVVEVEKFYRRDDLVSEYARTFARRIYG